MCVVGGTLHAAADDSIVWPPGVTADFCSVKHVLKSVNLEYIITPNSDHCIVYWNKSLCVFTGVPVGVSGKQNMFGVCLYKCLPICIDLLIR